MAIKLSDLKEGEYKEVEDTKKGGVGTFVKGVGKGIAKSFGELGLGVGQIGRSIQKGIGLGATQGQETSPFDPERAEQIRQTTLKANAPGEGTGKFIGTAAQFLAPTSQIVKGQQVLGKAATLAPKGTQTIAKGVSRFLPEAAGTGAVTAVRSGGDLEQAKEEGTIAGAFSVGLGTLGAIARSTYFPLLDDSVTKALGIQGKKSGGVALQQTAQKTAGLQVLKDNADSIKVTLDDGTKAAFDPNKATYNTTLQAWNETRKKIYKEYSNLSKQAGQKANVDLSLIRENLSKTLEEPRLGVFKNAAKSLLNDLDSNFDDLTKVDIVQAEKFLEDLNAQTTSGFFKGTADGASSEINAGTARLIREQLDDVITETTGQQYQKLRSQYSALKSIEDDLVRKYQQNARSIGGGLSEYQGMFASGDLIAGILSASPEQLAKGGTLGTLAVLKRKMSDPERFLKRSFSLIDNEAPKDLSLRLWGGSRALTEGESKVAGEVAESIKNPATGLSTKAVKPVGKELDTMEKFIDFQRGINLTEDFDPDILRGEAEQVAKKLGFTETGPKLADRFDDYLTSMRSSSFKAGETPTKLIEEAKKYKSAITDLSLNNLDPKSFNSADEFISAYKKKPTLKSNIDLKKLSSDTDKTVADILSGDLASKYKNVADVRVETVTPGSFYDKSLAKNVMGQIAITEGDELVILVRPNMPIKKLKEVIIEEIDHAATYKRNPKFIERDAVVANKGTDAEYIALPSERAASRNVEKRLLESQYTQSELEDIWKQANK